MPPSLSISEIVLPFRPERLATRGKLPATMFAVRTTPGEVHMGPGGDAEERGDDAVQAS